MKKFFAISLALILLFSNIGLTMATHLCGGHAVASEISIGHKHLDCGMPNMDVNKKVAPLKGIYFKALDCCENKFQSLNIEDEFHSNLSLNKLSINIEYLIALPFIFIPIVSEIKPTTHPLYKPPFILLQDTYVLNQAFLI